MKEMKWLAWVRRRGDSAWALCCVRRLQTWWGAGEIETCQDAGVR
jgi:hypothetical protein